MGRVPGERSNRQNAMLPSNVCAVKLSDESLYVTATFNGSRMGRAAGNPASNTY